VTNHKGSWKRTYAAAKRLIERDVSVLLKAPVMQSNLDDLADLANLARNLGAEWTFDPKLRSMENGEQEPILMRMNQAELRRFYRDEIGEFLSEAYKDVGEGLAARPLNQTPCRAGQQACAINPRGKVWPCNSLPIEVGDLRKEPFKQIWSGSDELDDIRDMRWARIDECRVCELRPYCQRCHAMAYLEHGKLKGPSLEACRHAVTVRDTLKEQGLVPKTDVALPPTWDRVDVDGMHENLNRKPSALRVIG
jgi:radical SAM protein with 4Fe4S-binding SPASM domain